MKEFVAELENKTIGKKIKKNKRKCRIKISSQREADWECNSGRMMEVSIACMILEEDTTGKGTRE